MGKGGTKFVGDAISVRAGRAKSSYTSKDLRKNMDKYLETGRHPDIEKARQENASSSAIVPLPDVDPHRPYVFMDISIDNKPAGKSGSLWLLAAGLAVSATAATDNAAGYAFLGQAHQRKTPAHAFAPLCCVHLRPQQFLQMAVVDMQAAW